MSNQEQSGKSGLVFGARNLGGAIIDTLIADGWAMAGVARTEDENRKIMVASFRYLDTFAKIDGSRYFAERKVLLDSVRRVRRLRPPDPGNECQHPRAHCFPRRN